MASGVIRLVVRASGAVQGVGFRPFAYRLACQEGVSGFVMNSAQGAEMEIEADPTHAWRFLERLRKELPPPGLVRKLDVFVVLPAGHQGFEIRESAGGGPRSATILPDLATCPDCLAETLDPSARRHRYPFTNCTHCGPRYSILTSLPYDRPNTTMAGFELCPACRAEYESPLDRRFHAQPIACPVCGPQIALWDPQGRVLAERDVALQQAASALRLGQVLAVKGLGGFHLMVRADDEDAVATLRRRKRREAKPLAVMVADLAQARQCARIGPEEVKALTSSAAPIVLCETRGALAPSIAPDLDSVGLMLPTTPLHHLLLREVGLPLVATSGNLSDEPLCTCENEALERFAGIADMLLVHNRPIARPIDDSVVRVIAGEARVIRRGRGFAPMPLPLDGAEPGVLAVGAHQKNAPAITMHGQALLGQHVGDLDTPAARDRLARECEDLAQITKTPHQKVIHDLHPDYGSTVYAESLSTPRQAVQHHVAHALALLAEHRVTAPCLVEVWDGTGLGTDGTIWGGETFWIESGLARRVATFEAFPLPGGEGAIRVVRRSALGLAWQVRHVYGLEEPLRLAEALFEREELRRLTSMLESGTALTWTTSAGRTFDAYAALALQLREARYEAEAAIRLEARASAQVEPEVVADWPETLAKPNARGFHRMLARRVAKHAAEAGAVRVGLTGGCFQNRLLTEMAIEELATIGATVLLHREVPPGDGGIAFGQLAAAVRGVHLDPSSPRNDAYVLSDTRTS